MGPRDWMETVRDIVGKIGNAGDRGGSSEAGTVFGKENEILEKLGAFAGGDGQGVRVVKSIQWKTYDTRMPSSYSPAINPVDTSRTVVLPIRLECNSSSLKSFSFKLSETSLTVSATTNTTEYQAFGFWIIEFY